MLTFLRLLAALGAALGAWQSWKAMGTPIVAGGKRWYRQPNGTYCRWWGGRARSKEQLDALR